MIDFDFSKFKTESEKLIAFWLSLHPKHSFGGNEICEKLLISKKSFYRAINNLLDGGFAVKIKGKKYMTNCPLKVDFLSTIEKSNVDFLSTLGKSNSDTVQSTVQSNFTLLNFTLQEEKENFEEKFSPPDFLPAPAAPAAPDAFLKPPCFDESAPVRENVPTAPPKRTGGFTAGSLFLSPDETHIEVFHRILESLSVDDFVEVPGRPQLGKSYSSYEAYRLLVSDTNKDISTENKNFCRECGVKRTPTLSDWLTQLVAFARLRKIPFFDSQECWMQILHYARTESVSSFERNKYMGRNASVMCFPQTVISQIVRDAFLRVGFGWNFIPYPNAKKYFFDEKEWAERNGANPLPHFFPQCFHINSERKKTPSPSIDEAEQSRRLAATREMSQKLLAQFGREPAETAPLPVVPPAEKPCKPTPMPQRPCAAPPADKPAEKKAPENPAWTYRSLVAGMGAIDKMRARREAAKHPERAATADAMPPPDEKTTVLVELQRRLLRDRQAASRGVVSTLGGVAAGETATMADKPPPDAEEKPPENLLDALTDAERAEIRKKYRSIDKQIAAMKELALQKSSLR